MQADRDRHHRRPKGTPVRQKKKKNPSHVTYLLSTKSDFGPSSAKTGYPSSLNYQNHLFLAPWLFWRVVFTPFGRN
jgi:hypothetical protein